MNKEKIKFLAASALLASNIVLLPGCYKAVDLDVKTDSSLIVENSALNQLNSLNSISSSYNREKKLEKIYSKINDDSVRLKDVLAETDKQNYTFYTTGMDVMVIIEGKENVAWFSSNILPSDAYSAIASYNENQIIEKQSVFNYLDPSSFKYFIGNTENDDFSVFYSTNGKLQVDVKKGVKKITICEVTPSVVTDLNNEQSEMYMLKQPSNNSIPSYAFTTLKYFEDVPALYMKDDDVLCVDYKGNYYETYIGFAEKDFSSLPFFELAFNEFIKNENVIYKA